MIPSAKKTPPAIIWWLAWPAITVGLVMAYFVVPTAKASPDQELRLVPAVPIIVAVILRWVVLPRLSGGAAFSVFIVGLALAESSAAFGMFLAPSLKQPYFFLSLATLAQYIPTFVPRENA
jgi:hypothetical protein